MTIDEIKIKLEKALTPGRFVHSIAVMETAVKLAEKYGLDCEEAGIAGLLHDCARDIKVEEALSLCKKFKIEVDDVSLLHPVLLHGPVGSGLAQRDYGICNSKVLDAISFHTTGRENMTMLDKIIFIADYIEPGRCFEDIEKIRTTAFNDIDAAMLIALNNSIRYIIDKGMLIHTNTIEARNFIIKQSYLQNRSN
jgi:predicted HD superfamily hydrolase involved in NAD metabolism